MITVEFSNENVDINILSKEILDSNISATLSHIEHVRGVVRICFSNRLVGADLRILGDLTYKHRHERNSYISPFTGKLV